MNSSFFISVFESIPLFVVILPILLLSIISFAVFWERYFFYRAADRAIEDRDLIKVLGLIIRKDFAEVKKILLKKKGGSVKSIYYDFIGEVLDNLTGSDDEMTVRTIAQKSLASLEKFASAVSTIATIAPMLGLFGTVTGIMKSFSALSKLGASASGDLASGITEALVTTALGLLVAIPAVIFYNYLVAKMEKHLRFTETIANGFLEEDGRD